MSKKSIAPSDYWVWAGEYLGGYIFLLDGIRNKEYKGKSVSHNPHTNYTVASWNKRVKQNKNDFVQTHHWRPVTKEEAVKLIVGGWDYAKQKYENSYTR